MQEKKIKILKLLFSHDEIQKSTLMDLLNIKRWQLQEYLRELERDGYLTNNRKHIRIQINTKTQLMKKLNERFDLVKLLWRSNDLVLQYISKDPNMKPQELMKVSGLSNATVFRALADFKEIRLISTITTLDDPDNLIPTLAVILKAEQID